MGRLGVVDVEAWARYSARFTAGVVRTSVNRLVGRGRNGMAMGGWVCKAVVEGSVCVAGSAARADSSAAVGSELGFQDQFSIVGRRGMVFVLESRGQQGL